MKEVIRIDDLSYRHAGASDNALDQISLTISTGERVALLGPSGAGKSTLLTLLDGRLLSWRGRVSVLGSALCPERSPKPEICINTGFIFQEFALVERSTVMRNVLNGRLGKMSLLRALFGGAAEGDRHIASKALGDCNIADLANRRVDSLSGGQRQRVAIARCLAQEPQLILADEPVSSLDPARAAEILRLLTTAAMERGATTLFSSHQPELARQFADRVIGMRNGRIVFDEPAMSLRADQTAELYRGANMLDDTRLQVVR